VREKVLFICVHNSCRSQMAEGFLKEIFGQHYEAHSAGIRPTPLDPYAVRVMKEAGVDISRQRSKSLELYRNQRFDIAATVCDTSRESCPYFPMATVHIHRSFPDPTSLAVSEARSAEIYRIVRDSIRSWILEAFDRERRR